MESEPKKPMEQMLEALAKARRAKFGDDPKMPNPMRARLHEEIARAGTAEDENGESRPSWITMFWPRVTVAAALATLLVLIPAIWWNQSHPGAESGHLALRDHTAAVSDGAQQKVNLADNTQIKVEPPAAALAPQAEASKWSTESTQGDSETTQMTKSAKNMEIAAAPVAPAPAGADSKAKSDTLSAIAPPVSQPSSAGIVATAQQFSQKSAGQSFRNNVQGSGAQNVLNTFQVQQEGNEIRVLDADGSTYTGRIEQSTKGAELDSHIAARRGVAKQTPRYAAKAIAENSAATPQSYFRATGYNVTLKRSVVFEGNYEASPAQQPTTATSNDRQRAEQRADRARIVGTARVNGEAPVAVDAVAETAEPTATKKSEK